MKYQYLMMNWCFFLYFLPTCESGHDSNNGSENNIIISVEVRNMHKATSFTYNKTKCYDEVWYHVNDTFLISCEQTSKKYTLSWTQQADNVSIPYPPNMAKKITVNLTLYGFDNGTILRCAAFDNGRLGTPVSNISLKFLNSQIESSMTYPENLEINAECPKLNQSQPYLIIDEKLYDFDLRSTYPNDTTKVCIHKDANTTNGDDIFIKRRVTYMNTPKRKIQLEQTTTETPITKQLKKEQLSNKSPEKGSLWMPIGGSVAGLTIFIIIIVIWKRKRKSSPDIPSDPIYDTAQDMNRVVYAELDMAEGSTFSPNREEVTPYAQVIGIIKMKNHPGEF